MAPRAALMNTYTTTTPAGDAGLGLRDTALFMPPASGEARLDWQMHGDIPTLRYGEKKPNQTCTIEGKQS